MPKMSQTSTTSLCHALETLGYTAIHNSKPVVEMEYHDAAMDYRVAELQEGILACTMAAGAARIQSMRDRARSPRSARS